jgi:hypothetical protein
MLNQRVMELKETSRLINNDSIIEISPNLIDPIPNEVIETHVLYYLDNEDLAQFSFVSRLAYQMVSNTECAELARQLQELQPSYLSASFLKSLIPAKFVAAAVGITLAGGLGFGISYATDASAVAAGLINATNTSFIANGLISSVNGMGATLASLFFYPSMMKAMGIGTSFTIVPNLFVNTFLPLVQGKTNYGEMGTDAVRIIASVATGNGIGILTKEALMNLSIFSNRIQTNHRDMKMKQIEIMQKLKNS